MKSGNPVDEHVGARVRSRRILLDMGPKYLADALGTTTRQVEEWEAGTSRIGAARLLEIARILGVDAAYFFAGSDANEPSA